MSKPSVLADDETDLDNKILALRKLLDSLGWAILRKELEQVVRDCAADAMAALPSGDQPLDPVAVTVALARAKEHADAAGLFAELPERLIAECEEEQRQRAEQKMLSRGNNV